MTYRFSGLAAAFLMAVVAPVCAGEGPPNGWMASGTRPGDYTFGTEHVEGSAGKQSAYIEAKSAATGNGFGTIMQTIKADDYIGQRLRLSARMKSEDVTGLQLWFRVDGNDHRSVRFYNMDDRRVTGTTSWKQYDIVLDVPTGSSTLNYGFFLLGGKGKGWADSFSLTPVDKSVPESQMPVSRKPVNLNFDQ